VAGRTFNVTVYPGNASIASELKGNLKLIYGKPETYVILTKDRHGNVRKVGGAKVYLALVAKDSNETIVKAELIDNTDGTHNALLDVPTLKVEKNLSLHVKVGGEHIHGSPFDVSLQTGAVTSAKILELDPSGAVTVAAGHNNVLKLQTSDEYGNLSTSGGQDVEFRLEGPAKFTGKVIDNDDGTYSIPYRLTVAGTYKAHVTLRGEPALNPVDFIVTPDEFSAGHSVARGRGIKKADAGEIADFWVHSFDRFGNEISTGGAKVVAFLKSLDAVDDAEVINATVEDNKDGRYKVSYLLNNIGRYLLTVEVTENQTSVPIAKSPFTVRLVTGPVSAEKTVVKPLSDSKESRAGLPALKFHLRDRFGNFRTKGGDDLNVYLRKPTRKPAQIVDNGDGTYDIVYPKGIEKGEYEVVAELRGKPVNLPLSVHVSEAEELPEEHKLLVNNLFPESASFFTEYLRNLDDEKKEALLKDLQQQVAKQQGAGQYQ